MHRSAVALAGAEDTLEAWRNGEVPPVESDGLLNGEEAAMLDLEGTWLVTLATCDSGRGEAVPGEGVLGLRRGFLLAGAQNVLTTLWPIDDETSAAIMRAFYQKILSGAVGTPADALAEVQLEFMRKTREEQGVYEAVVTAGAFAIVSQTAPH
jgi:CHAT domain-containing protein